MVPTADEPNREPEEIDLAHESAFALGPLYLSPATREVRFAEHTEILEPRVMQTLVCLVRSQELVVSRDDLIRSCWGGRIVGEDAINRCIGKVRQVAKLTSEPAFVIETIPRVGYRLKRPCPEPRSQELLTNTLDGRKVGSDTGAETSIEHRPAWANAITAKIVLVLVATVILVAAAIPGVHFLSRRQSEIALGVIALGPIAAVKSSPELESFGEALRRETLARLGELKLPVQPSVTIGAQKPEFILEGAVARDGDRIQVNVALRRSRDGLQIWTDLDERPVAEAAVMRSFDAARSADVIYCALDFRSREPGMSEETFRLFVQFCSSRWHPTASSGMITITEKLMASAPDSLLIQGVHARIMAHLQWELADEQQVKMHAAAEELTKKVLARDPDNFFAHVAAGALQPDTPVGWIEAERHYVRALATGPWHPWPLMNYIGILVGVGRLEEAELNLVRLATIAPTIPGSHYLHSRVLSVLDDLPGALRELDLADRFRFYGDGDFMSVRIEIAAFYGDPAKTLADYSGPLKSRFDGLPPAQGDCYLAFMRAHVAGKTDQAVVEKACQQTTPDLRFRMFAALGDPDRAFASLASAKTGTPTSTRTLFYTEVAPLRRDPRFWKITAKMGLNTYWTETGKWPDFCRNDLGIATCKAFAAQAQFAQ